MTARQYTPYEIEQLRERIDTLNLLDHSSDPHRHGGHTDPLVVERQLVTYMTNGTLPGDLEVEVENKKARKRIEEDEKQAAYEKSQWYQEEREILKAIEELEPLFDWAQKQKDAPVIGIEACDRADWRLRHQAVGNLPWNVSRHLENLDNWEHVPKVVET